jgi:hypothetical protein
VHLVGFLFIVVIADARNHETEIYQSVPLNVTCTQHLYLEVNVLNHTPDKDYLITLEVYKEQIGRAVNPKLKLLRLFGVQICCMIYISVQFVNFKGIY